MKKLPIAVGIVAAIGFGVAAPSSAKAAETHAGWQSACSVVVVDSSKDISNLVYRVDGVDTKIEFEDGMKTFELPGDATDVWIKSGNNHSGDGPGYGEHFTRPSDCGTSTTPSGTLDGGGPLYSL